MKSLKQERIQMNKTTHIEPTKPPASLDEKIYEITNIFYKISGTIAFFNFFGETFKGLKQDIYNKLERQNRDNFLHPKQVEYLSNELAYELFKFLASSISKARYQSTREPNEIEKN